VKMQVARIRPKNFSDPTIQDLKNIFATPVK